MLLYGRFGSYKTPITLNMARALATGTELWGLKAEKVSVLYLQCDMAKPAALQRIQKLGFSGSASDFVFAYPGFDIVNPNSSPESSLLYSELQLAHRSRKYKAVFVDSLRTIHSLEDHASNSAVRVYTALDRLFPGAAQVIVHHDRKLIPEVANLQGDDKEALGVESFAGSQAWGNHAAVGLKVVRKGLTKEVTILHTKSQAGEQEPNLRLVVEDGIYVTARAATGDVAAYLATLPLSMSAEAKDKAIAAKFDVSERTAQRRRLEVESRPEVGTSTTVGGIEG